MHEKMQTYCKKKKKKRPALAMEELKVQSAWLKQHRGWKGEMEGKQGN